MPTAIITTHTVRTTTDNRAVEVIAKLDAGEVVPGMFIHVPLNSMLDVTIRIASVSRDEDGFLRLLIDCKDKNDADIVTAFNFEDETLEVLETGEE